MTMLQREDQREESTKPRAGHAGPRKIADS